MRGQSALSLQTGPKRERRTSASAKGDFKSQRPATSPHPESLKENPHLRSSNLSCIAVILLVGATGVEPARIAPKDPKSFASANSATRPLCQSIFAMAGASVNSFCGPGLRVERAGIACWARDPGLQAGQFGQERHARGSGWARSAGTTTDPGAVPLLSPILLSPVKPQDFDPYSPELPGLIRRGSFKQRA